MTGVLEGAGAFTYSRSGKQLALYFALKFTRGDLGLILAIQDFFGGIGTIYGVKPPLAPALLKGSTGTTCYYRVCRREELERIVVHLDTHPLQGAKAESYAVWRQMVVLKRAFRKPPRDDLEGLATQLSKLSPRNRQPSASD